ncbi:MAG TPA: hypothetical protein VK369_05865 [Segetibacter sp.]|nr:hypothetical protein [Segetibacter sp.]
MEPIAIIRGGIGALAVSNFFQQQCIEYHFTDNHPNLEKWVQALVFVKVR